MAKRIFMRRKGEPWVDTRFAVESALAKISAWNAQGAKDHMPKDVELATLIVDGVVNWDQPECLTGGQFQFEIREIPDNTEKAE